MDQQLMDARLARLRRLRTMEDYPDDFLKEMIEQASDEFCDYCNREDEAYFNSLICRMAVVLINREGIEGSESASEGTMSRSWGGGDFPEDLRRRLNQYRMVKGLT